MCFILNHLLINSINDGIISLTPAHVGDRQNKTAAYTCNVVSCCNSGQSALKSRFEHVRQNVPATFNACLRIRRYGIQYRLIVAIPNYVTIRYTVQSISINCYCFRPSTRLSCRDGRLATSLINLHQNERLSP